MRRIFVENVTDRMCEIAGDEHKHLQVLRMRAGDKIEACSGDGFVYSCEITSVTRDKTVLKVVEKRADNTEAEIDCDLFLGIIKGEHMEIAVQKCTELGINFVNPIITENTVKTDVNIFRLQKIALEAAKQCGRGRIPKINPPQKIGQIMNGLKDYDLVVFPYEKALDADLKSVLMDFMVRAKDAKSIAIIIGPEGGFSAGEAESLSAISTPVTLGPRILRADTACIAATTAVMLILNQLKIK